MSRKRPITIAYDVTLPTNGENKTLPPVILLHGLTSSKIVWLNIPQTIADATTRKVYSLDARNHGESEWSEDFDYDIMAEDLVDFMDQWNIPQAVIVGHSMGGKVAMALALSKPEKVEKLVVEDISAKAVTPTNRRYPYHYLRLMRESLEQVPQGSDLDTARNVIAKYINEHTPDEHRSTKRAESRGSTLGLKMTDEGVVWQANIAALENLFINPKLSKQFDGVYEGEALFIYGTKSPYKVGQTADTLLKLFPKAVLSAVEGATHNLHAEFPEEFASQVAQFIGRK